MTIAMGILDNDSILLLTLVVIVLLLLYDIAAHDKDEGDNNDKKKKMMMIRTKRLKKDRGRKIGLSPSFLDQRVNTNILGSHGPLNLMNVYMPSNYSIANKFMGAEKENSQTLQEVRDKEIGTDSLSMRTNSDSIRSSNYNVNSTFIKDNDKRIRYQLTLIPMLPGCEAESKAANEMRLLFPDDNIIDILRFLIARKGDVSLAADMFRKSKLWHQKHLPLRPSPALDPVLALKCFFFHKTALDGTPILYFRGAIYNGNIAKAEQYILTAAHCIDYVLKRSNQISVTVFVHSAAVPGASNQNPDMDFIKGFASAMSDNFPERMKRLILWPFPWYGRAIWSCIKMFVDKRTQEKIILIPSSGSSLPSELTEIISEDDMPCCIGGKNSEEIFPLELTIDTTQD